MSQGVLQPNFGVSHPYDSDDSMFVSTGVMNNKKPFKILDAGSCLIPILSVSVREQHLQINNRPEHISYQPYLCRPTPFSTFHLAAISANLRPYL